MSGQGVVEKRVGCHASHEEKTEEFSNGDHQVDIFFGAVVE